MGKKATNYLCATVLLSLLFTPSAQGGHLVLVWEPNPEADIAGYVVHYGTRPGTYQVSIDVGLRTRVQVGPLEDSLRYYFAVSAYDWWNNESGFSREVSGVVGEGEILPAEFVLYPNYPNPFSSHTSLTFDLPGTEKVELRIFDTNGKLVRTLRPASTNAGANPPLLWDGSDETSRPVPSGIYYCQGVAPEWRSRSIRMLRLR